MPTEKIKVGVISLGCDKNRVDTEIMLANLVAGGYALTADPSDADVIIVNTCAFLESARKEAIDAVMEMSHYKQIAHCKKLIVTGCLGQKYGSELIQELDEADAVVGAYEYDKICEIVNETLSGSRKLYNSCDNGLTLGSRILTTAPHTAYLKIADGCNNFCTYCLIPHIRGRYRSVPMDQVVSHAEELAGRGVRELILVAQDTTRYGMDLYGELRLPLLLRRLSQIDGINSIRLLYCYPELMTDELLQTIVECKNVVNYVDIPLQHVNDDMLRKMNRKSDSKSLEVLFDKLESLGIAVRSTFICGFPGETPATVAEIEQFLRKHKLRNVGFFPYSREEGTPAANFDKQVPERTKQKYTRHLYDVQYEIVEELCRSDIGKIYPCIIDSVDPSGDRFEYVGRAPFMTPEIDATVKIVSTHELTCGEVYNVRIVGYSTYDLCGEVVD